MKTSFIALFAACCASLLLAETSASREHGHEIQNARCMKPGCYGYLRDGFGGGFNEKVYECSNGHKFIVKKR
jgi:hypothetical protein